VDSAYLQSDLLKETIYLVAPPGFKTKYARANKPVYGLAQAGRCFRQTLHRTLTEHCGLVSNETDPGIYYEISDGVLSAMVVIHVDDFLGWCISKQRRSALKLSLEACHDVTWTDDPHSILSLELCMPGDGFVYLTQEKYIIECMSKYNIPTMFNTRLLGAKAKIIPTPSENELKLSTPELVHQMQQLVGGANYASTQSRFDTLYMVNALSQLMTKAIPRLIENCIDVFRYLYSTRALSLVYGGDISGGIRLEGHSDASFPPTPDARAQMGNIISIVVNGHRNIISAKSRKVDHVCTSVTDAEISAGSECAMGLVAVRTCLIELRVIPPTQKATLFIDNRATVIIAQDGGYYPKLAHINRKHKYIMECVANGVIEVLWVAGKDNPADCLTKPLGRSELDKIRAELFT
jgi:hypothetical protein